jgi:hypothetical protein
MKKAHPTLGKYPNQSTSKHNPTLNKFGLNRALLPEPIEYLTTRGYTLKGRGEWRIMICPFHDDSSPSLRINSRKGCFKCMACEAKGGDIIAFHQLLTGKSFIEACKDLGAWEDHA